MGVDARPGWRNVGVGKEEGKVGNRKSKGIPKRAKSASGARVNSATRAGVGVPLRGLCIYLLCLTA